MASAGHTFATSDDASISISEELHELTSSLDPFRGKDAGDSEDLTEEQIRFIEDPASILSEKQRTALSEKEIALATDDLHCRQTTHLREQRDKLRFDVEVRFAEENKAELSAMKAAYERAGG